MVKVTTKKLLISTAFFASIVSGVAQAQLAIPNSAQVGQSDSSIQKPNFSVSTAPQINIPEVRVDNAPSGAQNIKLTLNGIQLDGVTAYDVAELQTIWADDLGKTISLDDVYAIAQKITRKYRNDGYIITQAVIPQQTIDDGFVSIQVVEGFIDDVTIQSSSDSSETDRVRGVANNLTQERPLKASALERWLLLVNDLPGMSARSIISPSTTNVGGASMVIIPEVKPYNASVNLDNYGTRFVGPLQASIAGQTNDILGLGEAIQLQYVTDPDDNERDYLFGRYAMPINNYGTTVGVDYTYSETVPGFELAVFDVEGTSNVFGLDVKHPLIRSRTQNLLGSLRFDYNDVESTNIVDSFATKDKIAALRLGVDYSIFDNVWKPAVSEVSMTISQGLGLFGASQKGDNFMTRDGGDPQFTKLELELKRVQALSTEFSLMTSAIGQLSNNPLLSAEEFGFGGQSYGRGYDSSEIVGDDALGASVELRWNPVHEVSFLDDYEVFGFYDVGQVWNQETDVDSLEHLSLASAGIGVRTSFTETISGEFIYAQPLTKDVEVYDNNHGRFKFSIGANF